LKIMNREQRERHEQGETDHKTFAVLRISRLDLLWTLPFRIMNREQRERRERYEKNIRTFRDFRVFRGKNYSGHSIFGGKGRTLSSWKIFSGHSLFCSRFSRLSRLERQQTLRFRSLNREQHEQYEQGETDHKIFCGENDNEQSR